MYDAYFYRRISIGYLMMKKKMINDKYTVLMSVYYKENPDYLNKSINSMLKQTVKPDEFIIIKDGKLTFELNKVIDNYKIKYPNLFKVLSNKTNLGLGLSLKRGIKESKNELIARMDSDDYSDLTRCEKELCCFAKDSTLGMVGTFEAEFIDDIDNVVSIHRVPENMDEIKKFMHRRCAVLHPTVMYKKSAVINSGNYHNVPLYEDYDLFARMILKYNVKTYNIQENLYYIRTSKDFYKRRGGIKYAKTVLKFKWGQFKQGYMTWSDFIISGLGQAAVCIMPNKVREQIYNNFLRK